jgi:GntR family transcriptional regulator, uxu operon transcriptional repressor
MPIQPIENQRLYRQVAAQLSALMSAGEFPEGSRLPSERDLAEQLGVSRPSVREGLIALEVQGKVEVRVGAGIFVARARPVAVADPVKEGQGPFELLRARWLIEGEISAEAARNASPDELEVVQSAVSEMKSRHRQKRDAEAADRNFHIGIAKATHNSALVSVVRDLWDQGRGAIWKRMEHHFETPELRAAVFRDHSAILNALQTRDAQGARAAMRQHLERVDREFNRGWDLLKERESVTPADTAGRASSIRGRGARS